MSVPSKNLVDVYHLISGPTQKMPLLTELEESFSMRFYKYFAPNGADKRVIPQLADLKFR